MPNVIFKTQYRYLKSRFKYFKNTLTDLKKTYIEILKSLYFLYLFRGNHINYIISVHMLIFITLICLIQQNIPP